MKIQKQTRSAYGKFFSFWLVVMTICSCTNPSQSDKQTKKVDENAVRPPGTDYIPGRVALRAFGEDDLKHYRDYDYYLLYLVHRPWHMSYVFSLRCKDTTLFSYSKYMDSKSSVHYPPHDVVSDSVSFVTFYHEHHFALLQDIRNRLDKIQFFKLDNDTTTEKYSLPQDKWLIVYDKDHGLHSLYGWEKNFVLNALVKYVEDSLMAKSPKEMEDMDTTR